MALAGLRNVPVLEPTIARESQSSSSERRGNQRRLTTRASSILQMWRELEDEHISNQGGDIGIRSNGPDEDGGFGVEGLSESESESVNNADGHLGHVNDNEDRQSMSSEQSQIFREWMNSGASVETPNVTRMRRGSRAQWLGENEGERVRIVREWVQVSSQQRDEHVAGIGSGIERVRGGHVGQNETRGENNRRGIRRLCGRQALLDLLAKKEEERRLELRGLEATRPVSSFAHRNRIQSLIRLRAFQNMRSAEFSRSSSVAESELGLLRQRQTVSGLREGFLSRLDNSGNVQANNDSDNNADAFSDGLTPANDVTEVLASTHELNDPTGNTNASSSAVEESDSQGIAAHNERLDHTVDNQQEAISTSHSNDTLDEENTRLSPDELSESDGGSVSDLEPSHVLVNQSGGVDRDGSGVNNQESNEILQEESDLRNQSDDVEEDVLELLNGQEPNMQVGAWNMEDEDREWESSILSNQWLDDGEESSRGVLENNSGVQNDGREDYWNENGSRDTPSEWLRMPSGAGTSSGRVDTLYFSDDDNMYSMEIRELLNRRTVSSLLHSGFRESLDQLIQSYVERRTQVPEDWELHEISPPFAGHNQEQPGTNLSEELGAARSGHRMPPIPPPLPQAHWRRLLRHADRSRHEVRHRSGIDLDTINDLRIDMARLQQRLNNMQSMLEACMDMQLELQRSVRQEVSAALNRSINPAGSVENTLTKDGSKWDSVRNGVCCICSNSNINSLLYRCGHMCTCTECATMLLEGNGKCPMCQAPVVEVIRAYFIQ